MSAACKIAISLPKKDYEELEAVRKKKGVSRSNLIDEALRFWLSSLKQQERIRQYEAGYRKNPEKTSLVKAYEKVSLEALDEDERW